MALQIQPSANITLTAAPVVLVFLFYLAAVLFAKVAGLAAHPKPVIWPHCET